MMLYWLILLGLWYFIFATTLIIQLQFAVTEHWLIRDLLILTYWRQFVIDTNIDTFLKMLLRVSNLYILNANQEFTGNLNLSMKIKSQLNLWTRRVILFFKNDKTNHSIFKRDIYWHFVANTQHYQSEI